MIETYYSYELLYSSYKLIGKNISLSNKIKSRLTLLRNLNIFL